jgi:hypothetical protein
MPFFASISPLGWLKIIIITALCGYIFFLNAEIKHQENTIKDRDDKIVVLTQSQLELKAGAKSQNDAIDAWKAQVQTLSTALQGAQMVSATMQNQSNQRVASILNAQVPQDCPGALKFLTDEAKANGLKWNQGVRK